MSQVVQEAWTGASAPRNGAGGPLPAPRFPRPAPRKGPRRHLRRVAVQAFANKMHFPKIFACVRAARRCRVPTRRRTKGSARPGQPPNREGGPGEAARRGGRSHTLFGIRKPLHDTVDSPPGDARRPISGTEGARPATRGVADMPKQTRKRDREGPPSGSGPRRVARPPARPAREGAARGRRISLWRV